LNQNSLFGLDLEKVFFAPGLKIVLQHYRPLTTFRCTPEFGRCRGIADSATAPSLPRWAAEAASLHDLCWRERISLSLVNDNQPRVNNDSLGVKNDQHTLTKLLQIPNNNLCARGYIEEMTQATKSLSPPPRNMTEKFGRPSSHGHLVKALSMSPPGSKRRLP